MDNQLKPQEPISKQTPVITDPIPEETTEPISEPEIETAPKSEYEEILNQYAASQQTETPIQETPTQENSIQETPTIETTPSPTEPSLSDFGIVPKAPQNNIFKMIFIVSLIIFLLVAAAFAFVYFKSQQTTTTTVDTAKTTPTTTPSGFCSLNDKSYKIGESFAAADGCNTCTCTAPNSIACTEKECLSSEPATKSATKIATKSATTTSTSAATKK